MSKSEVEPGQRWRFGEQEFVLDRIDKWRPGGRLTWRDTDGNKWEEAMGTLPGCVLVARPPGREWP